MQPLLPSAFSQVKDRKKFAKQSSISQVIVPGSNPAPSQVNYSMSPSKSGNIMEGKSIGALKGKSQSSLNVLGMNGISSHSGPQAYLHNPINCESVAIQPHQHIDKSGVSSNTLSQQGNSIQNSNQGNLFSFVGSANPYLTSMSSSSDKKSHQFAFDKKQALLINSQLSHQHSFQQHQAQQMEQFDQNTNQNKQNMPKSSSTFAKFKDLFGSKRLSEANAKQFLENSNLNVASNSSANFNKSSRLVAQIQVNKMTTSLMNHPQQQLQSKNIVSPKRAQIINHGYIIEDKKKKNIKQQYPEVQKQSEIPSQQKQLKQTPISRDSHAQQTFMSEDHMQIPNYALNMTSNGTGNNSLMNNSQYHHIINLNKGYPIESLTGNNINVNTLSEYKKHLQSQLDTVNCCLDNIKNNPNASKTLQKLSINIDSPSIQGEDNNPLLMESVMISAPQSVRNTIDSQHNNNNSGGQLMQQLPNSNPGQFFNFNLKSVNSATQHQPERLFESPQAGMAKRSSLQPHSQETKTNMMTASLKAFPKTTTSREVQNAQTNNNSQQFFLSPKAPQNKQHAKRLTLDSTYSQTLQSQRMGTSNNQFSSILSQSSHNQNNLAGNGIGQFASSCTPETAESHHIQLQTYPLNIGGQLSHLRDRICKLLNTYRNNKESSDRINQELLQKLANFCPKGTSSTYHTKSNSFQQMPQQALPLHSYNSSKNPINNSNNQNYLLTTLPSNSLGGTANGIPSVNHNLAKHPYNNNQNNSVLSSHQQTDIPTTFNQSTTGSSSDLYHSAAHTNPTHFKQVQSKQKNIPQTNVVQTPTHKQCQYFPTQIATGQKPKYPSFNSQACAATSLQKANSTEDFLQ